MLRQQHYRKRGTPRTSRAPWSPIQPVGAASPGSCSYDKTATAAFIAANPGAAAGQPTAYVSPTGGAPGTAALNDPARPYTLDYALRTLTTAQRIVALDGVYPVFAGTTFRNTDAAGAIKKLVIAQNPGQVILRVPGENLGAAVFIPSPGNANVWQTTLTGANGSSPAVHMIHRLGRTDVLDIYGYPMRFLRCASLAALNAVPRGYWVDGPTAKVLYLKWDTTDINTIKAALKPWWYDTAGTARFFGLATESCWDGVEFDGVEIALLGSGALRPVVWAHNCKQTCAPNHGVNDFGSAEAYAYLTNFRIHAPLNDGINLNPNATLAGQSQVVLAGSTISMPGDAIGLGTAAPFNMQAISSHGGRVAAFGNIFLDCKGQGVADTSLDPAANESWYVGCQVARSSAGVGGGAQDIGFGFYGDATNPDRVAYLEACGVSGLMTTPLYLDGGASVLLANSPGMTATVGAGSSAPGVYVP